MFASGSGHTHGTWVMVVMHNVRDKSQGVKHMRELQPRSQFAAAVAHLDHVTEDGISVWVHMTAQGSSSSIAKLLKLAFATIL